MRAAAAAIAAIGLVIATYLTIVRYAGGDDRHPYLTFNKTMGAEILRAALLQQRRRVEVYACAGQGKSWALERRGSPGNLQAFEEECMVNGELPAGSDAVIVAVKLGRTAGSKVLGAAGWCLSVLGRAPPPAAAGAGGGGQRPAAALRGAQRRPHPPHRGRARCSAAAPATLSTPYINHNLCI